MQREDIINPVITETGAHAHPAAQLSTTELSPPNNRRRGPFAGMLDAIRMGSIRIADPRRMSRQRRIDLFLNLLQVLCILTFATCVALDPKLHGATPKPTPQAKATPTR